MKNEMIQKAKEKILNSPVAKYVSEDKINLAFEKIYVYSTTEELKKVYYDIHYSSYPGDLKGFNIGENSYILNDGSIHPIVHEVLHFFSSEFEDGHRIVSGIEGNKDTTRFYDSVNEGLTDYLASKISGIDCDMYKQQKVLFEEIEESIAKFYENDDILFDIYLNKSPERLKYFIDTCLKEGTFEYIYNNYEFLDINKKLEITDKINKGAKKLIKKREFYQNHPFLAKIVNKISKNNNTYIPALKPANIINSNNEDLSSKLKEDIIPIKDIQTTEKDEKIEEKQINEETIEV